MQSSNRQYYFILSGLFFFFFFTWSSSFSLISIWLEQTLHLNGQQRGYTFSANAIVALCLQPFYGYVQDKLGLRKNLLWIIGLLLLLSGPFFIFIYGPALQFNAVLGSILGGFYVGATFFAGIGALESYIERVSRVASFEYGQSRMWGSLGWAAATFFAGRIFNINPNINFVIASVSAAIFLILLAFVKVSKINALGQLEYGNTNKLKFSDAIALFKQRQFIAFVIFVLGVSVYGVYDQQFPNYFADQFSTKEVGNEMYSNLNALQVFLEAGGMALAPFLVNRIGAKNSLVLSGIIMAIRVIGSGVVEFIPPVSLMGIDMGPAVYISFMKLLHAAELPILLVAIFKFFAVNFDHRLSATLYLVGFQFISQLSASVLSPLAGLGYDALGFPVTYMIMGACTAFFVFVSSFLLKGDKRQKPVIKGA